MKSLKKLRERGGNYQFAQCDCSPLTPGEYLEERRYILGEQLCVCDSYHTMEEVRDSLGAQLPLQRDTAFSAKKEKNVRMRVRARMRTLALTAQQQ